MPPLFSLLVLLASTAVAQFRDLATTADGSVLYFATSGRLAGTELPWQLRIYRVTPSGPELAFSEEYREVTTFYFSGPMTTTNFYALWRPQPSDDASVVAYTGSGTCTGYPCRDTDRVRRSATVVPASGARIEVPGVLTLSRNGRFAAVTSGIIARNPVPSITLLDLATGETSGAYARTTSLIAEAVVSPMSVSDNGWVILTSPGLGLVNKDNRIRVFRDEMQTPMIDRNATVVAGVVIAVPSYWDSSIGILRLEDPEPRVKLIHAQRGAITLAGLSGDGARVLFTGIDGVRGDGSPGARQLYVLETDGSGLRRVTQEPYGVAAATLSADGRIAWYVSGSSFLKKLDLETSEVLQEVGPSPLLLSAGGAKPGSLARLPAAGLREPVPLALDGAAVPVLHQDQTELWYQVPWDAKQTQARLSWKIEAGIFVFPQEAEIRLDPRPSFEEWTAFVPPHAWAVHAESGEWITPENPAVAGELVHLYARGLGAVDPAVATGQPAGEQPLSRLTGDLRCATEAVAAPLEFAGLAPLTVGIYQISLRVPLEVTEAVTRFGCFFGGAYFQGAIATRSP